MLVGAATTSTSGGGAGSDEVMARLEERVTEFTLANGLRLLVMERHTAPIVSVIVWLMTFWEHLRKQMMFSV